jgi:hypothetical protein
MSPKRSAPTTPPKHPMQPLVEIDGVLRFKRNAIVDGLLYVASTHGYDMNEIARADFTREDRIQFAQLIGYSLSGFSELPYVDGDTFAAAEQFAENGRSEERARIDALADELKQARDGMRDAVARLFGVHPDDLKNHP